VLAGTRNPLNLGAAARAMSNFGFSRLRVVRPYDLAFREARSAVGAEDLLRKAESFDTVADAVADCRLVIGTTTGSHRRLQQPLLALPQAAPRIRKSLSSGRVALLFGSEKRGLSNTDLDCCHWLVRIPTREQHPSMNLGQAVAICLYEIARTGRAATAAQAARQTPSSAGDLERITESLLTLLRDSGYIKAGMGPSVEKKVRRMVRRLKLNSDDANLWLGMLKTLRRS